MIEDALALLDVAGISPDSQYHKQGKAVICKLLEKESISKEDFIALTGRKSGDKLLEANVFAFHFKSKQVTFQSTLMKRACEKKFGKLRDELSR